MIARARASIFVGVLLAAVGCFVCHAVADVRVALVIGNSGYKQVAPLRNPANDAKAMRAALSRIGFRVFGGTDLTWQGMDDALRMFESAAANADVALVYYAGHGLQVKGTNYLVPVDARIADDRALKRETISLDDVLAAIESAGRMRIIILDACRDNPFAERMARSLGSQRGLAVGRGLARVDTVAKDMLIAYATATNDTADDGTGVDSPYTTALLQHLSTPGLELNLFFGRVRDTVMALSGGRQQPFTYGSLGGEAFYFVPPGAATGIAGVDPASASDAALWSAVRDSANPALLQAYLDKFPTGQFAATARQRLTALPAGSSAARESAGQQLASNATPLKLPNPLGGSAKPGQVFRDCDDRDSGGGFICPEMVVLPPGRFMMGVPAGEEERENLPPMFRGRSTPVHKVEIGGPLAMGRFSVTVGEFAAFSAATRRDAQPGCWEWSGTPGAEWKQDPSFTWRKPGFAQTDRHPVVCVSWTDARAYVDWLSGKTGQRYRLPTEAEWEYAARAGTTTARFWGADPDHTQQCRYANGADQTSWAMFAAWLKADGFAVVAGCGDGYVFTAPVGSFQPNPFGLYDMLGNVWNVLDDCLTANYNGAPVDGAAAMAGDCSKHVFRGGSWGNVPHAMRAGFRAGTDPNNRSSDIGFRVIRVLAP